MSDSPALVELGVFLTGTEAKELADRFADGDTMTVALRAVTEERRSRVRELFAAGGLGPSTATLTCAVLRAVQGAHSTARDISALWTMPGHVVQEGQLTSSAVHLIEGARQSITCSTFNFQRSSGLWAALRDAAARPGVVLRVYLDTRAADRQAKEWTPTTDEVAAHLSPATVLRTRRFDGAYVRNHAKFLAIDHRFSLITSANFSRSAEYDNVELGVIIDDVALTESIEREMVRAERSFYEAVAAG